MIERYRDLMDRVREEGHDASALGLLEEAITIADALQDVSLGMEARDVLVTIGCFGGRPECALVAFSWMIARFDEDQSVWSEHDILWKYKWFVEHFPFLHQVDLAQIERTFQDMEARYERAGHNLRPVHHLRAWNAMWQGRVQEALHQRDQWLATPRDALADCPACELNYRAWFHREAGEEEEALRAAEIIWSGRAMCGEIPHVTFAWLLPIVLRRHGRGEADPMHRRGYELVRSNPDFIMEVGKHVAYLSHTGRPREAVAMTERHLSWLERAYAQLKAGHLIAAFEGALRRLVAEGAGADAVRVPPKLPGYDSNQPATVEAMEAWARRRREAIAADFDARNGNDAVTRRLAALADFAAGE